MPSDHHSDLGTVRMYGGDWLSRVLKSPKAYNYS